MQVGHVVADRGGEPEGIAPLACYLVRASAVAVDIGVELGAGTEVFNGERRSCNRIADVPVTGSPHFELPKGIFLVGKPVECGRIEGNIVNGQAVGRGTKEAVGGELDGDPVGEAEAIGTAVLPQRHLIGSGGRLVSV